MAVHPDQKYIAALLENDVPMVDQIYRLFSPSVRRYILQNRGDAADAADILQEALLDIYHQARYKALTLTCPFEPFLLLICKRKWINQLKKRGRSPVTKVQDDLSDYGEDVFASAEQLVNREDKVRLFLGEFARLGEKCREIIKLSLSGRRQEEIAAELGVSYGYLRKKKSECLATLMSYIEEKRAGIDQ
ncbi:MAG TPA: RNA polymerase sigma factor [Puia sp.]|jgi:RNA polymerase sigma factor (sigma-70 family)|nr:RNA polymerase sigma factor [Puia sp.]